MSQEQATNANKSVIAQKITDPAGRMLIAILLAKPCIDLTYSYSVSFMGIKISALHMVGLFVLFYFFGQVLRHQGKRLIGARLFTIFILVNFLSVGIGLFYEQTKGLLRIVDLLIRLLDSYFIFLVAGLITVKYKYEDFVPFIKAAAIGVGIAVVINFVAVELGYGGSKIGSLSGLAEFRNRGLYYDPGVLSKVALSSIVFSVAWMTMKKPVNIWRASFCMLIILVDFYLIYLGLSRTVMIIVPIFFLIYFGFYLRSWARVYVPGALIVLFLVGSVFVTVNLDRILIRFSSDFEVFSQALQERSIGPFGPRADVNWDLGTDVSFGVWEKIGNNRIKLWAYAINDLRSRSFVEIIFGNFRRPPSHSDYFDVLGRNGIVGLCLYVGMLVLYLLTTFSSMRRSKQHNERLLHLLAFSMLVIYVLYSIPFRPLFDTTSSWYMWIVLGFSVGLRARLRQEAQEAKGLMAPRKGFYQSALR